LLVVDSLTGQDAVNVAKGFAGEVDLSGVILTRMDGDARGGAALSMRAVTGKPIKFAGRARRSTRSKPSTRAASPAASSAWATSSASSSAPPRR
jgi:signal recognition particle subunit SRP54